MPASGFLRALLLVQIFLLASNILASAQTPAASQAPATVAYEWHVTLGIGAPDCFQRNVILVNDTFQPTLEVRQGSILELTVVNDLPDDFIDLAGGISIHWHGFSLPNLSWYDGTSYGVQCPIAAGESFTYRFPINEPAGSYLWHDHSQLYRADGLQGALVVLPREGGKEAWDVDQDFTLFVSDWFHGEGDSLGITLQRPFDPARQTPEAGKWQWVGLPQAQLINGHGYYEDCPAIGGLGDNAGTATYNPVCNVTTYEVQPGRSVQQPEASPSNPGCTHANFTVEEGSTNRFRLIANTLVALLTVCFEGHNVTVIAADATPVQPISFGECVDVSSGQRMDVLLTADQPVDNYWITLTAQYRKGAPNGYGILHYEGAPNFTLPESPVSQPGTIKAFSIPQVALLETNDALVSPSTAGSNGAGQIIVENYVFPANATSLAVPQQATKTVGVNITQPLIKATGQLRWALNNVVEPLSPPCTPLAQNIYDDPAWLTQHMAPVGFVGYPDPYTQEGNGSDILVFDVENGLVAEPSKGLNVLQTELGDVTDIILQNNPSNAFGGDYRGGSEAASRNTSESHPFHMHGHHFFVLGAGNGSWDAASSPATYNLRNPVYRDTVNVLSGGWTAIRFTSDNPGVWPLHCHLDSHFVIGQALYIVESVANMGQPPSTLPVCARTCTYSSGPFSVPYVNEEYASDGFEDADENLT